MAPYRPWSRSKIFAPVGSGSLERTPSQKFTSGNQSVVAVQFLVIDLVFINTSINIQMPLDPMWNQECKELCMV